jgi:hypothetical protein
VPATVHHRVRRGPFGALLILLSLLLSAGTAAAGSDSRASLARLGQSRHGTAATILPFGTRNSLDDEAPGTGGGSAIPSTGPSLVTQILWTRPLGDAPSSDRAALPRPAGASYRARAPPAS